MFSLIIVLNHKKLNHFIHFVDTAVNVKTRHQLLQESIGVFPEEEKAYLFVSMMSWLLPLLIFVGALLDALFVYIYMNFAHPWIDILSTGFSSTLTFF